MSLVVLSSVVMAAESHEEVNGVLNWTVGAGSLLILMALLGALVAFGGGREHS
jgi:predicted negative regulator of RcsB-dependent stress response